jgi:hypothetical protein
MADNANKHAENVSGKFYVDDRAGGVGYEGDIMTAEVSTKQALRCFLWIHLVRRAKRCIALRDACSRSNPT